jgi:hypothetical protein
MKSGFLKDCFAAFLIAHRVDQAEFAIYASPFMGR